MAERARYACSCSMVMAVCMHPRCAMRVCVYAILWLIPSSPCSAWRMYSMCRTSVCPAGSGPLR